MKIWQQRRFAWLITIILIFAAVFGCSGGKLATLAEQSRQYFYAGEHQDGLSIDHDLTRRADAAYNLYTVAARYLAADDGALIALLAAREQLLAAESVSACYAANTALSEQVMAVYTVLGDYELSEKDAHYRQKLLEDLQSANAIISHDGYNAQAAECNQKLAAFPASLIGGVWGIEAVEYFR
ncbi:MAG: LemA family protein [Clostridiales bacterium]